MSGGLGCQTTLLGLPGRFHDLRGHLVVAVPQVLLEFHRRHDRVHRTGELCDQRVSGTAEDASVVGFNGLVSDSTADFEVAQG